MQLVLVVKAEGRGREMGGRKEGHERKKREKDGENERRRRGEG